MKTFVLIVSIATGICVCRAFGQANGPSLTLIQDKYVTVDGHKMHYHLAGSGSPTVVFECGVSDNLNSWNPVFSEVAKFTKTISYDRMGLGSSEPATAPRSFRQMATELHFLLANARIFPPYILVGHSMGGR
jgi:pimeloyl-ACP methyl ester carboxylesterase